MMRRIFKGGPFLSALLPVERLGGRQDGCSCSATSWGHSCIISPPHPQPLWEAQVSLMPLLSFLRVLSSWERIPRKSREVPSFASAVPRPPTEDTAYKGCFRKAGSLELSLIVLLSLSSGGPHGTGEGGEGPHLYRSPPHLKVLTLFKVELGANVLRMSLITGRGTRRLQIWLPNS